MTSVIRPDTLYFGTLYLHFKYISEAYRDTFQNTTTTNPGLNFSWVLDGHKPLINNLGK